MKVQINSNTHKDLDQLTKKEAIFALDWCKDHKSEKYKMIHIKLKELRAQNKKLVQESTKNWKEEVKRDLLNNFRKKWSKGKTKNRTFWNKTINKYPDLHKQLHYEELERKNRLARKNKRNILNGPRYK